MKILGHTEIKGEVSGAFKNYDDFPLDPKVGTWAYIHKSLMMCVEIGDLPAWIPLTSERNTVVHDQETPSERWFIEHDLNSDNVLVQCYDRSDNVVNPSSIRNVDGNVTEVIFPDVIGGRAILMYGMESGVSAQGRIKRAESYKIGNCYFTTSSNNPFDDLGYGEWELLTGDAVLGFGDGSECSTDIEGTNSKSVPLPAHTHQFQRISSIQTAYVNNIWAVASVPKVGTSAYIGTGNSSGGRVSLRVTNSNDTTGESGASDAKVNVKPAVIKLNVWCRTG